MVVYATIAQWESFCGLSVGSGSDDNYTTAEANEILERASREVEDLTGTVFTPIEISDYEYYSREETTDPSDYIYLKNPPLVSTTEITIELADTEAASPTWTELGTADYLFDGDRRVKLINPDRQIVTGIRTARVKDYTYGVLNKYWEVVRLTVVLATLNIAQSPKGKNALLNTAEFTLQSAGEVASPAVLFRQYITDLELAKDEQLKKIGVYHNLDDQQV